jgi:hypothetical protein
MTLGSRGFDGSTRFFSGYVGFLLLSDALGFGNLQLLLIGLFGQVLDSHGGSAVPPAVRLRIRRVKALLNGEGYVLVDRAGVRLFLLDAKLRQQLEYFVGLDFQLTGQLIDSDFQLHR